MNKIKVKAPTKAEKRVMRALILLGLVSVGNFFYWFFKDDLIANPLLYGMLLALIVFDVFRLIYIWYHYWNITVPKKPENSRNYSVDVFTTFCDGEPEDMVINTLYAIQKISYPHTTYLCDEDDNPRLKSFCEKHHIIHVTRNERTDAKAGNINNALKIAKGEICLILDPDHIPEPNFLDEVIPYFEDDTVGFVQTVQSYYNVDESRVAQAAAEQTFQFYGPVMMSMNTYGTVNAIGANCVFRREALDSIDGHAAGLSEDMHTAMKLHAKGWKSIYIPKALSAGLAPRTLSAYYKQQLKWSRGTFDLLFTAYPKLAKSFTLRQKLHYGILPFHYLAGFFFMFSFLIPIISLLFSTTPWKGNVINFGAIALPILVCLIIIRFYSQKWLVRESERGFHILGGLLLQCTWWVYINGVLFTIFRKKVPYLPTLKNDESTPSLTIVLPNLIIGFLCLASIVYGLKRDFTPFSIVMALFAFWNACILFYTVKFAYDDSQKRSEEKLVKRASLSKWLSFKLFDLSNKAALPIVMITLVGSIFFLANDEKSKLLGLSNQTNHSENIKYLGVFAPQKDDGITHLDQVRSISERLDQKFDIISYYIPWDKNIDSGFDWSLLDSVYQNKAIPLITWEPWLNTFEFEHDGVPHVNDLILSGELDNFLEEFAIKLKKINRPIFLRFSHEFDNPFYPWYDDRENAHLIFKNAWKHVHAIFSKNGADNVIWVWNPWKAQNIKTYFPGNDYVDWFGVNILNYATFGSKDYYEFSELYGSFRNEWIEIANKPVIITELGTLNDSVYQQKWFEKAFESMANKFKEIDAFVYFSSHVDDNFPVEFENDDYLNWSLNPTKPFLNNFKITDVPSYVFVDLPDTDKQVPNTFESKNDLKNIKGVNLVKGKKWREDFHILNRENLVVDFEKMKAAGINAIKFENNPVYNYNVINLSKEYGLKMDFGFEIPSKFDFIKDTIGLQKLTEQILKTIENYKSEEHIMSWHIQNDVLSYQETYFNKPEIFYQKNAYLSWLDNLCEQIRELDARPIVMDIEVNQYTKEHIKMISRSIHEYIIFGLIANQVAFIGEIEHYLNQENLPYLFSVVNLKSLEELKLIEKDVPFYLPEWQDQFAINYLSFDGLIDRNGLRKADYFKLKKLLLKDETQSETFKIKIIKPLRRIVEGYAEEYHAMILDTSNSWQFADKNDGLYVQWSLIKLNGYGNYISAQKVGEDPVLTLKIPENYGTYNLELSVTKGEVTRNYITPLNTPYILK